MGADERNCFLWNNGWHESLPYSEYPKPIMFKDLKINEHFFYDKMVWIKVHEHVAVLLADYINYAKFNYRANMRSFFAVPALCVMTKELTSVID